MHRLLVAAVLSLALTASAEPVGFASVSLGPEAAAAVIPTSEQLFGSALRVDVGWRVRGRLSLGVSVSWARHGGVPELCFDCFELGTADMVRIGPAVRLALVDTGSFELAAQLSPQYALEVRHFGGGFTGLGQTTLLPTVDAALQLGALWRLGPVVSLGATLEGFAGPRRFGGTAGAVLAFRY
jgi:hypothetical protein